MIEKQFTALLHSFVQDTAPKTEEPWNMAELQRAAAQQNMLPCWRTKTSVGGSRLIRKFAADWTVFCTVRLSAT